MTWLWWRRRKPSKELIEAQEARQNIESQQSAVDALAKSLKEIRQQNHLAELLTQVIRSVR